MKLNHLNIGVELNRWFSKSILLYNDISFTDEQVYKEVLPVFVSDYKRYYPDQEEVELNDLLKRHELVGILLYRIARSYFLLNNESIASKYSSLGTFLSGFEIYYSANIGKGLKINHGLGMVIGARTNIGDNALLHQGVTFGDRNGGRPIVKDNVTIYAGAKILGEIVVGSNSVIGANSVCLNSIPENTVVAGIPAKIIMKK